MVGLCAVALALRFYLHLQGVSQKGLLHWAELYSKEGQEETHSKETA